MDNSPLRRLWGVIGASVCPDDSRIEQSYGDPSHRDSAFTLLTNRHTSRRFELILNLDRSLMNSPTEWGSQMTTVPLLDEHYQARSRRL